MLKLPNSIEPAVMAENIVHLRDGLAAVDAKTLPATTSATTGQILKLTGENKTPAWADEYSYTPPAYSTTETATGQKWIDEKDIYCKVFTGTTPGENTTEEVGELIYDTLVKIEYTMELSSVNFGTVPGGVQFFASNDEKCYVKVSSSSAFNKTYIAIFYYTKPDPTPGRAPEDPEQEPEEKKTTKKKTTK